MQQVEQVKERVFGDNGETIEEVTAVAPEEVVEQVEEPAEEPAKPEGKYRIGDKWFQTQEEAMAYAQSQISTLETEQQIADAYRQGIREGMSQAGPSQAGVTPEVTKQDDINPEELYTNPQEFLAKYATKIKSETKAEIEARQNQQYQSDQIWREFTDRHPQLADFRKEVENYAAVNTQEVRAIIATKGRPAAYDYVATRIKAQFEAYANAVKPKRELPNTGAGTSPTSKAASVTPKPEVKKPLSMAEQIRMIKKKR